MEEVAQEGGMYLVHGEINSKKLLQKIFGLNGLELIGLYEQVYI